MGRIARGTPRWAVWTAYATIATVVPSAIWRTALGFGADLGTTQAWRDFQQVPGWGTVYVVSLSVLSVAAASLTLGLVQAWGEVLPSWIPALGGRPVPTPLAIALATTGAVCVIAICAASVLNWEQIIEHNGRPGPGWYALATAVYLPAPFWGPLLLATTFAYAQRRRDAPVRR